MPFLKELANGVDNFNYYYGGLGKFSQKPEIPTTQFNTGNNLALATARDVKRIGNFFLSANGITFIAKQVGLQLSNPLLEQPAPTPPGNVTGNFIQKAGTVIANVAKTIAGSVGGTRVYNLGINTLTQVGVQAFGGHIVRHGLLPTGASSYNYENVALENNKNGANRLVGYFNKIKDSDYTVTTLKTYIGGPNTAFGIGTTTIKTTNAYTDFKSFAKNNRFVGLKYSSISNIDSIYNNLAQGYNGDLNPNTVNPFGVKFQLGSQLAAQTRNVDSLKIDAKNYSPDSAEAKGNKEAINQATKNINSLQSQIFRADYSFKDFRAAKTQVPTDAIDYYVNNIESRIGISTNSKVDSINVINIASNKVFYEAASTATLPNSSISSNLLSDKNVNGSFARDIIKFRLEFLDNDSPVSKGDTNTDVLAFRAYINDFNDGIDAKWDAYRYMGRGEEFYVYNGFSRDISVTFTIFAHSKAEMKPIYNKLNYLMSTFTPDYNENLKMRGNIGYLTIGDYVLRQPGIFTSMRLTNMIDANWELALNEPEKGNDSDQYELPKYLTVTLQFKPIHSFLPRKNSRRVGNKAKFITPDSSDNKFLSNIVTENPDTNKSVTPIQADTNTQILPLSNPSPVNLTQATGFKSIFGG